MENDKITRKIVQPDLHPRASILAKLHPVIYSTVCYIKSKPSNIKIMAVLDTGSSSTIIDKGFAQHNNLKVIKGPYTKDVNYIDRPASYETSLVEIELIGQDTQFRQIVHAETVENFSKACFLVNWAEEASKYPHLKNVSIPVAPYPPIGVILIGIDNANLFEVFEKRFASPSEPIANRTPLGWALMGNREQFEKDEKQFLEMRNSSQQKSSDDFLDAMVTREFELEQFGLQEKESPYAKGFNGGPKNPASWSPDEKRADDKMKVTHKDNYFQVNIPWNKDHDAHLHGNFNRVKARQENSHTEIALARKGIKIHEIDAIIKDYVDKHYIEEVPRKEQGYGWYLPFFEVVNREKSTPIRLVFDAKAVYGTTSLNNQILDTPNRLNDLVLTLMRMRQYEFAITGDISEMFLRIRMATEDRKYHRFFHNDKHFQWTRILFGNKSSPNASQKVLSTLSEKFGEKFPEAKETVDLSCYMDDCVDSRPTEKRLLALVQELPELLKIADMKICKFYTNSKIVAAKIPRDLIAREVKFEDKDPFFESNKVLGMVWDAESDSLTFKTKYNTFQEWKDSCKISIWTKRAILKTTASTYDPLGLLSPIVMYPRTIIQQLWSKNLDWDQPVGEEVSVTWEESLQNLLDVNMIRFPRWIFDDSYSELELHVFCDASERAYCSCIYSRVISRGGEIFTNLVCAKSRVAPLKNESVQRLELVACVLGTRLLTAANIVYKVAQARIYYHTDSRNSLYWINTPAFKQKVYVYNRSSEIQRVSKSTQWAHVATELNPADIGTRYVSTSDLRNNTLWFQGPPFLRDPNYTFKHYEVSQDDLSKEAEIEMKTASSSVLYNSDREYFSGDKETEKQHNQPISQFWMKKVQEYSVGNCWNGLKKLRNLIRIFILLFLKAKKLEIRSVDVYRRTDNLLYRISQQESFQDELGILKRGGKLAKGHILAKYNPYVDEHGVLRSNSRLDNLDYLPEESRRPVILYGKNSLTRLIVCEAHIQYEHTVSRNLLLAMLHKKYIIIGVTKLVQSLSNKCIQCQKRKAQPIEQIMAPLQNRIGMPNRAFAETGIDFAGPFETIQGRGKRRKRYFVLVLTCLQTRAVHFEATEDQTTSTVVNALSRFASIRGRPSVIVSDNQTSFKAASKEIKDFYLFFIDNLNNIEKNLNKSVEPIEWIFIPPRAPHHGGAWEIMVKAMKRALSAIGKGQPMTEDDFRTFLAKAMDMINHRPLLKHYTNETSHILTPNDFLIGRCEVGLVPATADPPGTRLGARWRQLETLSNALWHRFMTEILPEISCRQKWKREFNNLEKGMLVLLIDPNVPRNAWKLGIVDSVELGRDGFARSATVRVANKSYDRPITKLIPLLTE